MTRQIPGVLAIALLLGVAPSAQQQPPSGAAKQPAPIGPEVTTPGGSDSRGQAVNVRLDLTITDQMGPGEPSKKTVSMLVADRSPGSIRSSGNSVRATLNVDATPQILPNGNIKVQLGLEYNPRQTGGASPTVKGPNGDTVVQLPVEPGGSSLNQRVAVVLEPGKPLVLSQAADPISDRKITVEVRAQVMK
jgi:hypothetical protein